MEQKLSLSFSRYRAIDLSIFALLGAVFEFILVKAAVSWFPDQLYTLSGAALLTAIVMMRWGAGAAVEAALCGLVYALAAGGGYKAALIYAVGNLTALLMLLFFRGEGKKKIAANAFLTCLFGLGTVLLMQTGRAALSLVFGNELKDAFGYYTSDVLSGLFTVVVLWIARRADGVFEDQKTYLLRKQQEFREERMQER